MTDPIPTAMLAQYFLKEKMSKWDMFTMFASIIGVVMINNPGNILNLTVVDLPSK